MCLLFFVKLDKISYAHMDTDENVQWHEAAKITSVFILHSELPFLTAKQ